MFRRFLPCLCLAALAVPSPSWSQEAPPLPWKAGAARVKITPAPLMWMSGYAARTKPAEGTLNELWARALVLEDAAGHRGVLVSLDLVGIDRELSLAIRNDLHKKHGLPREAVILATSHTHSGPVVRGNLDSMYDLDSTQRKYIDDYARFLHEQVVRVVGEALGKVAPARVEWANGYTTFAVNRRNNKEPDVPKLREAGMLKGPVDHEVPVLAVRDPATGRLRAVAFGYACHATVLSDYLWSGDYPGFAMDALEEAHPDLVALFWAGCGADQNPVPRRQAPLAKQYGKQLAEAVETVLRAPMTPVRGELRMLDTEIDLPYADLPTRDQLLKDTMDKNRYVANRARLLLKQIEQQGSLRGTYPYPVQLWRLGSDPTWITLGGEVVVDYSLRLKKELGPGKTWVAGYTNDVMAYIPSLRVLKEGGYEGGGAMVYYGLPTVWSPKVEELIVAAVHGLVEKGRAGGK